MAEYRKQKKLDLKARKRKATKSAALFADSQLEGVEEEGAMQGGRVGLGGHGPGDGGHDGLRRVLILQKVITVQPLLYLYSEFWKCATVQNTNCTLLLAISDPIVQ